MTSAQTPPPLLLLGFTLLFWGWLVQLLPFAIIMAVLLEAPRWIQWRWQLTDQDFIRFANFCSLLLIGALFYLLSQQSVHGLFTLLSWLPLLCFPLIAAQLYSTQGRIKMSSLFLSLRHLQTKTELSNSLVDLRYPYFMLCLIAASAEPHPYFFWGVCLLGLWSLSHIRPRRYSLPLWLLLSSLVIIGGYLGQFQINRFQHQLESWVLSWFETWLWQHRDPYQQRTALGDIGRLKQYEKIVWRVKTPQPILLREASYNTYFGKNWYARQAQFQEMIATHANHATSDHRFTFTPQPPTTKQSIIISGYFPEGKGMLASPTGLYQLSGLPMTILQYNDFGAIKTTQAPGVMQYQAHFNPQITPTEIAPSKDDLHVPQTEINHLTDLAKKLKLDTQIPPQKLQTVKTFFKQNFKYSLTLSAPKNQHLTPLAYFLHHHRTGHCEYFATATALLLRAAGLPTRYAAGYAVEEYSLLENQYIVRKRHAHAWTLVYLQGRWQNLDTTPAEWISEESANAPWWQALYDTVAWLNHRYQQWRWQENNHTPYWLLILAGGLILILAWRLYAKKRVRQRTSPTHAAAALNNHYPGKDSPFYQIITALQYQYPRLAGETLTAWLQRIHLLSDQHLDILKMLRLHERYRFDAQGLTAQEKTQLTNLVKAWLKQKEGN